MPDEIIVEGEAPEVMAVEKRNVVPAARSASGSLGMAAGGAVSNRVRIVLMRVSPGTLPRLYNPVDGEVACTCAEGVATLIAEGIRANHDLFARLTSMADQIAARCTTQVREGLHGEAGKSED